MKYLKLFNESKSSLEIDTNIVMDVLTQLKDDDKYNIDINQVPSDIDEIFTDSIKIILILKKYKENSMWIHLFYNPLVSIFF